MIPVVGKMPVVDAMVLVDGEPVVAITVQGQVVRDTDGTVVEKYVMIRA
jgi:hypothetical protein